MQSIAAGANEAIKYPILRVLNQAIITRLFLNISYNLLSFFFVFKSKRLLMRLSQCETLNKPQYLTAQRLVFRKL
jgi:hypothetical protein